MKARSFLAFSMLIVFSISGIAQKPASDITEITKNALNNSLSSEIDNPDWTLNIEAIQNLNLALANRTYIEKIDSLMRYSMNIDSGRYDIKNAEYYLFDALGRNYTRQNDYYNSQTGSMVPGNKTILKWNTKNQVTDITSYNWDEFSSSWKPGNRTNYLFNDKGLITKLTQSSWNVEMGWQFSSKDTTIYNEDGTIQSKTSYYYDNYFMTWIPSYKEEHKYNPSESSGEITNSNWYGDISGFWEYTQRTLIDFDDMGRSISELTYSFDGEMWSNNFRKTFKYDDRGNLVLEAYYFWSGSWWDGDHKVEYVYDENNRMVESTNYIWEYEGSVWSASSKINQTWDDNGNLTGYLYSIEQGLNKFVNFLKAEFDYDQKMKIEDVAMNANWTVSFYEQSVPVESFNNKLKSVSVSYWNIELQKWDRGEMDTYHYSKLFDMPVNDAECKADFTWTLGKTLMDVNFSNQSDKTVVAWYWMFGDGHSSTERNPTHIYKVPGSYRVVLTTIDELGFCSNTIVKQLTAGIPLCKAEFTALVDTAKQAVSLTNISTGNNLEYFWSFGDGSMSKEENPVHTYEYPGSYPIWLSVKDAAGTCMDMFTAKIKVGSNPCNAAFVGFVDSISNTVMLRAKDKNPLNLYRWVLGDGTVGFGANQNHSFTRPGHYSATLTVSNALAGCVESSKETFLVGRMSPGGQARYIYAGGKENTVVFTNKSLGSELSYLWDFNDTETSTEKDPTHKFVLPGYYDVCLTVVSKNGLQNTYCKKVIVGAEGIDDCMAKFEYTIDPEDELNIQCMDRSFGEPDNLTWVYNSNGPFTGQEHEWTAPEAGFVTIRHSIENSNNGCKDEAYGLVNMGIKARLKAAFGYSIRQSNNKAETYPVDFIGVSLGDAGKLKWSFGDGTYDSTSINPVHYYQSPGQYEVCLTITNGSTGEEDTSCEWVTVGQTFREKIQEQNVGMKSYPNPFNESTKIEIQLMEDTGIDLSVYDLMGRKVKTVVKERRSAGSHIFKLNGSEMEAGNYYLILETGYGKTRSMLSIIK